MSNTLTNSEVARMFQQVAAVYSLQGQDAFRIQAYLSAASSIEQLATPLQEIWQENQLQEIPGIGEKFSTYLDELFRTGHIKRLERILKTEPAGMYPLLDVSGIGPKTAYKLAHAFKLRNAETAVGKVLAAAKAGKIRELEGFSAVSEQKILLAIERQKNHPKARMLVSEAEKIAQDVMNYLRRSSLVLECEALGSLRRHVSTVGDIDIAVATQNPAKLEKYLLKFPHIRRVLSAGEKMVMFVHSSGWQVDVKTQLPEQWGSMLQHYTGSKLHNIHLRTHALSMGLSLSENGIKKGKKLQQYRDETSFYQALKIDYIPPELREDGGEIEAARAGKLPKLLELGDIKGDFHIHTNLDFPSSHDMGRSSIAEILQKAVELKYTAIGLSDHNPRQSGLSASERVAAIKKRNVAIDKEVAKFGQRGLRVFKGLEVDILPDGRLPLSDEELELLDYAIVSIHSQFQMDRGAMTQRILKGLAHPKVKIWGHPSGRLLEQRAEIECDWQAIFSYCAANKKYIEVNASPQRLDLAAPLIREAIRMGAALIINTDAHDVAHMDFMQYGVWEARRGWVEAKNVVNAGGAGRDLAKIF